MQPILIIPLLYIFMFPNFVHAEDNNVNTINFSQFTMDLPPKWDGAEQIGFISDNPEEYALTLGRKDEEGDRFEAQVTIYLLPNKPKASAEKAAQTLAEAQGDATEPIQEDNFWVFEGEPRTNTIKGRGITMVNADAEDLLIIIAQDPLNLGAKGIISSLKATTPRAKKLLGR